jgi:hypothetical protein
VAKAPFAIFVGVARGLDDPVQREVLDDDQLAHQLLPKYAPRAGASALASTSCGCPAIV